MMAKWKPIESAPKDGTRFLAFWSGDYGTYTTRYHSWGESKFYNAGGRFIADCQQVPVNRCPTHWMPLPAPPKESE